MRPTIEQYKELINKGLTSKQIGNLIGKSASTVKRDLISHGLKTIHWHRVDIVPKEDIEKLIEDNLSIREIAEKYNCSQMTIKQWLKKYQLKTHAKWNIIRKEKRKEINNGYKTCPKCQVKKELNNNNFYIKKNGNFHGWCKECNNKFTYNRQKQMKIDSVNYKGGKCYICGYNKYFGALDFHHLNPNEKDFAISDLRSYTWEKVKNELDKCICVCRNCHAEIHGGVTKLGGGPTGNRTPINRL